jgi:hypothetical protein
MAGSEPVDLGPFRVVVEREREAEFCREIGFPLRRDGIAPASFPAVWMCSSEIRAIISRELGEGDAVPLHESQIFSYVAPLRVGESYEMNVALRRESEPPRLIVEAQVATLNGEPRVRIETMLRIVSRSAIQRGIGG